ncbi:MAG: DUF5615 family PIN-like protein [Syntrophales bacterium]|nr:DUF5615 family PIN-like protein [Syntrophales bacterium]
MKVVIDECLPRRLANALAGHKVWTVQQIRLNGLLNGALLKAIKDDFDVFITVDQNLVFQQNLKSVKIAVIVLSARTNRFDDIQPLIPAVLKTLQRIKPGQIIQID